MSVLNALYLTYNNALINDMVDRTDLLNQQTVLLPVYHSNKKSTGANDIIEITLSENGDFIKAEWVPKDQIIIFPITENSIIRAGKVIAPHPLCDELSYLAKEFDSEKHNEYIKNLNDWIVYMEERNCNRLLRIVSRYIFKETIYQDCINNLFSGLNYQINNDFSITINPQEKSEKVMQLEKTFITFKVETESSISQNLTVSTNREIHQNYIDYVRYNNEKQLQTQCDISGEVTYCVSRHRGLLGNAKLISISNHNETYYGRFDSGDEVVHIGYEVSQKIHLMIKYFLENHENRKQLGDSSYLINWFSDDIGNTEIVKLTNTISPYDDVDDEDIDEDITPKTLGGGISSAINDYITGKKRDVDQEGKFYLMILDKIVNGRISVKYFKELPKSDLFERVEKWYQTASWPFYSVKSKHESPRTPSLFLFADAIFGNENSKGYIECKAEKLRTKTVERLLPCILEHKKIPLDLKNRMFENLCKRSSYHKTWNLVLYVGCSILKKYQLDYQIRKEVKDVLELDKQERSYLYGRLLAVYEKLEQDALRTNFSEDSENRITNAERLWTAYTKMPARTLQILEEKIRPYKERLKKNHYGNAIYYDKLTTTIMNQLGDLDNFTIEKNKPLNEEFIFGYYGQKQEFYKKRETQQINDNKENEED